MQFGDFFPKLPKTLYDWNLVKKAIYNYIIFIQFDKFVDSIQKHNCFLIYLKTASPAERRPRVQKYEAVEHTKNQRYLPNPHPERPCSSRHFTTSVSPTRQLQGQLKRKPKHTRVEADSADHLRPKVQKRVATS